jgi:uncharacterized protein
MQTNETIIAHTKNWIINVVIGCNFCPFAAREIKRNSILYEVKSNESKAEILQALSNVFAKMDNDNEVETAFLILPNGFNDFNTYLNIVDAAEQFLAQNKYEGIYQIASFHPQYLFAGSSENDASNYTNRSPYPMLHVLRESSLTKAIDNHPDLDSIPNNNIEFANKKGLDWMKNLLESAKKI